MNKFKKISLLSLISIVFSLFLITPSVSAAPYFKSNRDDCNLFLGLTAWDCGVVISDQESLINGIWQIAANVATDITIIAAYLVLGYVIYGGYLYTTSGGDPGKTANGKKTLAHAFIGLAIVLSANLVLSTIRFVLLGANGKLDNCVSDTCVNPGSLISNTINWFIGIAGVVSVVFIIYGGVTYMTSAGDPNKLQKAKQMILYALIGLAIVALATAITAFVTGLINDANQNALTTPETFNNSKELYEPKII